MGNIINLLILLTIFTGPKCINGVQMLSQRNWDWKLLNIFSNSTNEDLLDMVLNLDRVGRGEYAFSGYFDVKTLLTSDFYIYAEVYRSKSGIGEYFKLPYAFPNQTFDSFLDTTYKSYLMDSFKNCSNWPQFEGQWQGPSPMGRWWLKMCCLNADDLKISYLQDGYYKVKLFIISFQVTVYIEYLMQIEKKA